MATYCKKPCKHCPFRHDVKPFLHPDRAAQIAYSASNPYNDFPCHKTTEADEENDSGEMMYVDSTKTCAGFLTLQAQEGVKTPEGFEPSWDLIYTDAWDMIQAYEEEWESNHPLKQ